MERQGPARWARPPRWIDVGARGLASHDAQPGTRSGGDRQYRAPAREEKELEQAPIEMKVAASNDHAALPFFGAGVLLFPSLVCSGLFS
jgi:hypothetical protein